MNKDRIDLLTRDLYHTAFTALDLEPDLSTEQAAQMSAVVCNVFRELLLTAFHPSGEIEPTRDPLLAGEIALGFVRYLNLHPEFLNYQRQVEHRVREIDTPTEDEE